MRNVEIRVFFCFTLCLVGVNLGDGAHRKENMVKTVFFTFWQKKENGEEGKPTKFINPTRQNKKKEAQNNHPTTKLSTTTKHRNLAQKINQKSTEN